MRIVDAVLLAAGRPDAGDPMYRLTRGGPKALLPIAGRPMIHWVLEALEDSREIRNVIVVGLTAEELGHGCRKPLFFVDDHGELFANLLAGGRRARDTEPPATHILAVSSDIPAVTPEAIDWHVAATHGSDYEAYAFVISRPAMEQRFPGSGRSFVRLREGRFAGGDLSVFKLSLLRDHLPVWPRVVAARKSFLAQARLVGLDSVVLFLLGRLTLAGCADRVRTRLGVDAQVLVCPHAEAGMDVDKPAHHTLLASDLSSRIRRP